MLCVTAVTNDLKTNSSAADDTDGNSAGTAVSYEWFTNILNTALTSITSGTAVVLDNADADILRRVAVLYRVTQYAVDVVGRGSRAATSLLNLSSRCYEEQFAADVASRHGLVSLTQIYFTSENKYSI